MIHILLAFVIFDTVAILATDVAAKRRMDNLTRAFGRNRYETK